MPSTPSWPDIVRTHGPAVWRTIYRLLADDDDAAECYQEVFLEALKLSRTQRVDNWGGMLTTIAARRGVDRLRQRLARRQLQSMTDDLDAVSHRGRLPSDGAGDAELAQRLRNALADLPPNQAEAFWLSTIEELSYAEIASRLSVSVDNVGVLLHRARATLRETLGRQILEERTHP
jgi:RNA polymerase sigma-70 factor (ECF subfamily)